jgi:AraC family transcriptional regulator of adaptative response/methylated-DNA-[protein]-cysteine methyltransferase
MGFVVDDDRKTPVERLERTWPGAKRREDPDGASGDADRIFGAGGDRSKPLTLLLKGTNFQLQVWQALLQIPAGAATSYGALAELLDRPTAARAVGAAVGKNPVAYLIPCHRVLRESGAFGGYHWGTARKQAILGWEAARAAV